MKSSNSEVLLLLIKHGADKNIMTDFEERAFDLASENELLKSEQIDIDFLK